MHFAKRYTSVPNTLIDDTALHYTSKVLFVAMALSRRRSGLVRMTIAELAIVSGLCEDTVLQALRELEAGGFIRKKRNWRWSKSRSCPIYDCNTYKLRLSSNDGFTLIPSKPLETMLEKKAQDTDDALTPAGFCVLLFLYRCAGRTGCAFPSIRYIAGAWKEKTGRGLCMAKSTVLRALKLLGKLQAFQKNPCDTKLGDKSCNSYYMTDMVLAGKGASDTRFDGVGRFFGEQFSTNKITETLLRGEEHIGVREFGNFTKNRDLFCYLEQFFFDGTGVKVSFCDEQELTI